MNVADDPVVAALNEVVRRVAPDWPTEHREPL
jgi:hypothetical protein